MNKVELIGRLTKDPDVRYSQGQKQTAIARYTLAVERRFKRDGEQSADFINCVALGKNGEFAEKYLKKGMKIAVAGHIQTGNYTNKDGQKVYTTDVMIDEHEFCESRNSASQQQEQTGDRNSAPPMPDSASGEFMNIPDSIDEELPFN